MKVPATPVVEAADIRVMYDVEHAMSVGKGGYSHVVSVLHLPTNKRRALKVMHKDHLKGKVAENVLHEREILRRTSHPNIITLHETITTAHHVYFALDLMSVDLFEFVVRNKKIPEPIARVIMHQVLCGIKYLHDQCIVHRDIKPENILLNISEKIVGQGSHGVGSQNNISANEEDFASQYNIEAKIADFGLAKLVQEWDVKSTPCGTSFYIAPEVIRGIESQGTKPLCTTQKLVKSVDVWSAGVVLFIMLSGHPPFHGQVKTSAERRRLLSSIHSGVLFRPEHGWANVSAEAKDLIVKMLEQENHKRLTAMEALQHPFFTNYGLKPPEGVWHSGLVVSNVAPVSVENEWEGCGTKESAENYGAEQQQQQQQQQQPPMTNRSKSTLKIFSGRRSSAQQENGKEKEEEKVEKEKEEDDEDDDDEAEKEHMLQIQAEINAIQEDIIATGDEDGDKTSYVQTMPSRVGPIPRVAVMNANAKVGPAALRK